MYIRGRINHFPGLSEFGRQNKLIPQLLEDQMKQLPVGGTAAPIFFITAKALKA